MKKYQSWHIIGTMAGAAYGLYSIFLYRSLGIICNFSSSWVLEGGRYNPVCALEGLMTLHLQAAQSFIFRIGVLFGKYITMSETILWLLVSTLYAIAFITTVVIFAFIGNRLESLLKHGPHTKHRLKHARRMFNPEDLQPSGEDSPESRSSK